MIVLDTNVVSEPLKANANPAVIAWLDRQAADTLFLAAPSLAELLVGIEILPDGRRKGGLANDVADVVDRLFTGRILPFHAEAAKTSAILIARARGAGMTITVADGQIAAIAASNGFAGATRDTAPFVAAGVPTINPWDAAA